MLFTYKELLLSCILGGLSGVSRAFGMVSSHYLESRANARATQCGVYAQISMGIIFGIYILLDKNNNSGATLKDFFYCFFNGTTLGFKDISKFGQNEFEQILKYRAIIFRCLLGCVAIITYLLALFQIDSGDFSVLRNTTIMVFSLLLSTILFKTQPSWVIIFLTFPLCIAGMILIDQPQFIFSNSNQLSNTGVILSVISGTARACADYYAKKTKGIHWSVVSIMVCLINLIGCCFLMIFDFFYYGYVWTTWTEPLPNIMLYIATPVGWVIFLILNTLAYQKGEIFILSIIIVVSEVFICYIAEIILWDTHYNMLTYVGCGIIFLTIFPINYQLYKIKKAGMSVKDSHPYELIPDEEDSSKNLLKRDSITKEETEV